MIGKEGEKMREHKYQAWDKETKNMYQVLSLAVNIPHPKRFGCYVKTGEFNGRNYGRYLNDYTLREYTGLHDVKGKEIYDGDCYTWLGYEVANGKQIRPQRKAVVGNELSSFIQSCFEIRNLIDTNNTIEVIGNIYENPDLLK
jgi:hypothetical protein